MQRRGSALIISIFLITLIGGVTFSLGRLLFAESINSNAQESGVLAYYAAESGLEEGFLRYRYNQNYEVPFPSTNPLLDYSPDETKGYRTNITTPVSSTNVTLRSTNIPSADRTAQVYDLRMGSLVDGFGNWSEPTMGINCGNPSALNCVVRDEAKKFNVDFSDHNNKDVNLRFTPVAVINGTNSGLALFDDNPNCVLLEVKITGKINVTDSPQEKKKMFYNATCNYGNMITKNASANSLADSFAYTPVAGTSMFQIDNVKAKVWPTLSLIPDSLNGGAEISIKPIGANIALAMQKGGAGTGKLYGPTSTIESYGYYDGVSRGLEARIDRQSGTLYDLYDYVIYKAIK